MTTGTYNFTLDNSDILNEAFERTKNMPASITAEHIASALTSISLMLVQWMNDGFKQYRFETITLNATNYPSEYIAGGDSFVLPARVIHILAATYKQGNSEVPIGFASRTDYVNTNDKTHTGRPTLYFLDRAMAANTLYIYPTLQNADDSIVLTVLVQHEDVGDLNNNPPVHLMWFDALAAGLAARLNVKFGKEDRQAYLDNQALAAYQLAKTGSREFGSTFIKASLR